MLGCVYAEMTPFGILVEAPWASGSASQHPLRRGETVASEDVNIGFQCDNGGPLHLLLACDVVLQYEPLHDVLDDTAMALGASGMFGCFESSLSNDNTVGEQPAGEGAAIVQAAACGDHLRGNRPISPDGSRTSRGGYLTAECRARP